MLCIIVFFFNDTAPTVIYPYCPPLSLHDALPIFGRRTGNERPPFDPYTAPDQKRPGAPKTNEPVVALPRGRTAPLPEASGPSVEDIEARLGSHAPKDRSEEHTSELQSLLRNSYAVLCL